MRIVLSALFFAAAAAADMQGLLSGLPMLGIASVYILPYLIAGAGVITRAVSNIARGEVFDENFLMTIATFGAFAIGKYDEAVAVMLFYRFGEYFQNLALEKSRKSISEMMDIVPEYVNFERDGKFERVSPGSVPVGSIIAVLPGERVPLDGVVISGRSYIDMTALTGESLPKAAGEGDEIYSGCVNGEGAIKIRTSKVYEDSTVARILELVEAAADKKAKSERFITRFAKVYTPLVTVSAILLAIVPPLFAGGWAEWIRRACVFLVISCPCALVISVPLGFFAGIGAASRAGILAKGANCMEAASRLSVMVFDKTGTLSKGEFSVTELCPSEETSEEELLRFAAAAEYFSTHPIAQSIRREYARRGAEGKFEIESSREKAGHGVSVIFEGEEVLAGSGRFMLSRGIDFGGEEQSSGSIIHVAAGGLYKGFIVISDAIKADSEEAVEALEKLGVSRLVIFTGDGREAAEEIASLVGIDEVYAELLPADKVARLEELLEDKREGTALGFAGDGINDAPVLMRADLGFAMGSLGSDAAIEAADVVIMDDDPRKISRFIEISRGTLGVVRQNIIFAIGIKLLVLVLGALGIASLWAAVFADVGVALICILNSVKALRL